MGDVLPPKRQAVVDRLRRRIESYRRRQSDCIPRFDQSFNGICEQNIQETLVLKQRFLESKAKRVAKKTDKKDSANSLHTQQKFLKRTAEELDPPGGSADAFEPPAKIQCTGPGNQQQENLTKFSVEIVQQLEFTTSAANSQPQQISTNVTVKALTNASVKSSDVASPKSPVGGRASAGGTSTSAGGVSCVDIGNLVECKQEPDNEFVDLEQCAAALEKDAAANGASFPGFSDLIGDDTSDEIITSDAFKDLISEISDFHPEFMKDFDFEDKTVDGLTNANSASGMCPGQLKVEDDSKDLHLMDVVGKHSSPSPLMAGNQYSPQPVYDPQSLSKARMAPYPPGLAELSPAAQTLKQMAEQHQHKTQLGMGFNPAASARNVRSPYGEFQFPPSGGGPGSGGNTGAPPYMNKQVTGSAGGNNFVSSGAQVEILKQEVVFSAAQMNGRQPASKQAGAAGNPMMGTGYPNPPKQQYSPYGSPGSLPNHGSPQYLPRGQAPQGGPQHVGQFSSSTPPRPPSCPGTASLQINQAQQMHINQQGQQIQVTAGQHMQLSGDLKPDVSVAAQQGMYFSQQQAAPAPSGSGSAPGDTYTVSQSQTINFTQQNLRQRPGAAGGRPGVDATVGSRQALEQQHKLIQQQQQMLRAQQQVLQQQSHMASMGPRPPPPEYKANPQLMLMGQQQQQQRFTAANMRRVGQQPMPPSGPMMRPQQQQQQQTLHGGGGNMYIGGPAGMVQHQHRMTGTYVAPGGRNNQRPPNVSIGPDGINIGGRGGGAEWRHLLMSQQQNAVFATQMRPTFTQGGHQGSFGMGSGQGGVQLSAAQQMQHQQLVRNQTLSGSPVSQMQMISQQQSLGLQSAPVPTNATQMSMSLQMSQSMSVSGGGGGSPHHHPHHSQQPTAPQQQSIVSYGGSPVGAGAGNPGPSPLQQQQQHPPPTSSSVAPAPSAQQSVSQPPPPTPDFSLEFLEHLPTGDSSHFSAAAQELLNSLDSTSAFNLDIL